MRTGLEMLRLVGVLALMIGLAHVALILTDAAGHEYLRLALEARQHYLQRWWRARRALAEMWLVDRLPRWIVRQCVISAFAETSTSVQHARRDPVAITCLDVIEHLNREDS